MTLNASLNAEHRSENFQYKGLYSFTIAESALNVFKVSGALGGEHKLRESSFGMNIPEVSVKGKGCKYSSAPGVSTSIKF